MIDSFINELIFIQPLALPLPLSPTHQQTVGSDNV